MMLDVRPRIELDDEQLKAIAHRVGLRRSIGRELCREILADLLETYVDGLVEQYRADLKGEANKAEAAK